MPRRLARCAALLLTRQNQLAFASCTRPALAPLLRSSMYCVSFGALTRATASLTAFCTQASPSFLPQVAALWQSTSAAKRMRIYSIFAPWILETSRSEYPTGYDTDQCVVDTAVTSCACAIPPIEVQPKPTKLA